MKVLVGCEESGIVRRAFKGRGHDAYSCDLVEADDGSGCHFQKDVMDTIRMGKWDLIILHPPCTALSLSGNRWYGRGMPRHQERIESVEWTLKLWELAKENARHVALENPKSVIFPILGKDGPVQYIQPYHFGHSEMKETGFALYNLPRLEHVGGITPPDPHKEPARYAEWQKVWRMPPSPDRKKMRSRTYLMVADAMATQWGAYVKGQ